MKEKLTVSAKQIEWSEAITMKGIFITLVVWKRLLYTHFTRNLTLIIFWWLLGMITLMTWHNISSIL